MGHFENIPLKSPQRKKKRKNNLSNTLLILKTFGAKNYLHPKINLHARAHTSHIIMIQIYFGHLSLQCPPHGTRRLKQYKGTSVSLLLPKAVLDLLNFYLTYHNSYSTSTQQRHSLTWNPKEKQADQFIVSLIVFTGCFRAAQRFYFFFCVCDFVRNIEMRKAICRINFTSQPPLLLLCSLKINGEKDRSRG